MKKSIFLIVGCMILGAVLLWGGQQFFHYTNSTEFCVSCHSMSVAKQEWEGSVHFSNKKGIRAECADCHIPQHGLDYLKTKIIAAKDIWAELTNKLPDEATYEKHRLSLAQTVWDKLKKEDSATCRSCHEFNAMELSEQSRGARTQHQHAMEVGLTCIDCHKGVAHFLPDMPNQNASAAGELAKHGAEFNENNATLYTMNMSAAQDLQGNEVRLLPFAELTHWSLQKDSLEATLTGWQQAGAESVVYAALGQRIIMALLDENARQQVTILQTIQDEVTHSQWQKVQLTVKLPKQQVTANLAALNQYGSQLNNTYCSGCHGAIAPDHYTANQWVGVVNSMKDRTSISEEDTQTLILFLQRNSKDFK